jgi:hypothetical protein
MELRSSLNLEIPGVRSPLPVGVGPVGEHAAVLAADLSRQPKYHPWRSSARLLTG